MFTSILEKKSISYIVLGLGLNFMAIQADWNQDQEQNRWNTSYDNEISDPDQDRSKNKNTTGISDQELTKKIRDKIGSGWFTKGYDDVTVKVNNGVVTLGGFVKTDDDKEKVEKDVRNIDGVKSVNSRISIQETSQGKKDNRDKEEKKSQDSYATAADKELNKKIHDKVSIDKDVTLSTANSVVTLEGTVDNENDQQKLIKDVLKIEGVKAVRSNLTFKNNE